MDEIRDNADLTASLGGGLEDAKDGRGRFA
jgi:hypothetical protein